MVQRAIASADNDTKWLDWLISLNSLGDNYVKAKWPNGARQWPVRSIDESVWVDSLGRCPWTVRERNWIIHPTGGDWIFFAVLGENYSVSRVRIAVESVVGGRWLTVVLREQSRVNSVPVRRGKHLFLSVVLFHWKANSYHLIILDIQKQAGIIIVYKPNLL